MRKTLASLLLCSLLAPACSKNADMAAVEARRHVDETGAVAQSSGDRGRIGADASAAVGSGASTTVAMGSATNGTVAYNQPASPQAEQPSTSDAFKNYGQNPWIDA